MQKTLTTRRYTHKHTLFLISAALVILTAVAYWPIRHNGFVDYDDDVYITKNPKVTEGLTPDSVIWAFTHPHQYMWHPLTTLSHILDCQFFGLEPFWHHLVSLLFHTANALLLFWILSKITGSMWASAFVAAVFALHPLQVESVAWAAERKTVLSGFFWLLTIAAYIWYTKKPGAKRYILLFVTYALCIMTKPVVITLPLVLLLMDYWPLGRFKLGSDLKSETARKKTEPQGIPAGKLIIEKIPLLVLSALLAVATVLSQKTSEKAVITLERIPLAYRISNMFLSYIRYIGKMIWPGRLAVFYPHPDGNISAITVLLCALLFVLISALCIYIGRRKKYAVVGWLWFVGTLVPMIGLVQVGNQAMADRYMYIAMLGLLFIIVWSVKDFISADHRWKTPAAVSAALVLVVFVMLTRTQVKYWQNSLTLFAHALKVTENNTTAENNYGHALLEAGRPGEAVKYLADALDKDPALAEARINLGLALRKQGKLNEAIACFKELIRRGQVSAKVYYNLVVALSEQKKYDEAIKYLSKAMALDPTYPNAKYIMGSLLMSAGRTDEAVKYFEEMLKENKYSPQVHYNLAATLSMHKKYDAAIKHLARVLELDPNYPDAHNTMGTLLASKGRFNEAVEQFKEALRKDPENPVLYTKLGLAYQQLGKSNEAIRSWSKAAEIKPDDVGILNNLAWAIAVTDKASAQDTKKAEEMAKHACKLTSYSQANLLDTLAAAYAANGRFDEAIKTADNAIDIAKTSGQNELAGKIEKRIDLYRAGKRYIQK